MVVQKSVLYYYYVHVYCVYYMLSHDSLAHGVPHCSPSTCWVRGLPTQLTCFNVTFKYVGAMKVLCINKT